MRWRTGDKEVKKSRFLQSIPGILYAEQPETRRNSLHEAPTGRNNQFMRIHKLFSYQEIQEIKEDLGDYLEDSEKYMRSLKGVTLLYDLTWKDVIYILGQMLTPDSKKFWEKQLLMDMNGLVMNQ